MQGPSPASPPSAPAASPYLFSLCLLLLILLSPMALLGAEPFPRYPVIEQNVRFWEAIYGRYSTRQGVVHDSNDLAIVYEVIALLPPQLPGSSTINKAAYKKTQKKYSRILKKLARGTPPRSSEERRVAALFGTASHKRLTQAAQSIRLQSGQKDRFLEGVLRSGAYMGQIQDIFKREGLPTDLAYLPHVESSFNIKAYSKFGASGIWQFTRGTGKQFLNIDYALDERQDPILASRAAAKFLKKNYALLGNWPLALTAYNYGPAGMLRALKIHLNYEDIFSHYQQGWFKFASRNFYSEFLAAVRVAKGLERSQNIRPRRPQRSLDITLASYIAAKDLCAYFKISIDTLSDFNPALRASVLQGTKYIPKGYTVHLPYIGHKNSQLTSIPRHLYHRLQRPTQFYRVRPGDTAGRIAQRHKVSLKALRRANKLDQTAIIFVGQNLRLPSLQPPPDSSPPHIPSKYQKVSRPGLSQKTPRPSPAPLPLLNNTKKQRPVWKDIQGARSVVLMELRVRDIRSSQDGTNQGSITILPNESLELLAGWLKISPRILRRLNNFSPGRILHPDDQIQISLNRQSAGVFEEKRFDFHLETEEDFFSAYKIIGVSSYLVQQGDTVWDICRNKFDLPLWLLKKYNSTLDFRGLRSSQRLTIPIVKAI